MMKSQMLGEHAYQPEITNISSHGVWLLHGYKELFISYEDFPWFKNVSVGKIINVEDCLQGIYTGLI